MKGIMSYTKKVVLVMIIEKCNLYQYKNILVVITGRLNIDLSCDSFKTSHTFFFNKKKMLEVESPHSWQSCKRCARVSCISKNVNK